RHESDTQARPLNDSATAQRRDRNSRDHLLDPRRDSLGNAWIAGPSEIHSDLSDVGDGPLRILDLHAGRKLAKAALTSSSLAASPASPSSIANSSSGVASYSAPASSASISSASSASSCCQSSGQVDTRARTVATWSLVMAHSTEPGRSRS